MVEVQKELKQYSMSLSSMAISWFFKYFKERLFYFKYTYLVSKYKIIIINFLKINL